MIHHGDNSTSPNNNGAATKSTADFNSYLQHSDYKYVSTGTKDQCEYKRSNYRADVDSAIQNQVKEVNDSSTGQPIIRAINTTTALTLTNRTVSLIDPTILQGTKGTPLSAFPAQPPVTLPEINGSIAHIPRNVLGDAAWPPVRPPSSGPRETEIRVQANQGAVTAAALEAWRTPPPPATEQEQEQELKAALANLLRMTQPQPAKNQVSSDMPHRLNIELSSHVPRSIDVELLRDPEADVSSFPNETVLPPHQAKVRYYTNSEANKRGALTDKPRERLLRENSFDETATEGSKAVSTSERATGPLSTLVPSPAKTTVPQSVARPEETSTAVIRSATSIGGKSSVEPATHPTQVAKAAPVQSRSAQAEGKTPIDRVYLDLVLDGRMMPDDKVRWVDDTIKRLTSQKGLQERPSIQGSKEGCNDPADLRIQQDPLPLAQPEGGGGGDPRDVKGPGTSSDLEQLTRLLSGDHGLPSSFSPGGKSEVGLRSDVSDRPLCTPVFGHVLNITHSKSTLDTAAQARIPVDIAQLHPAGGCAAQPRPLYALAGSEYLQRGRGADKRCSRWTARVGVSLNVDGSLTARLLEGIVSTRREIYGLPSGNMVGNVWNIALERIVSETEHGEDAQEALDAKVLKILGGSVMGERLDEIQDAAVVRDERSMQQVLSRVLRLLGCVPQSGGEQNDPADLRIPQNLPSLAQPGGG